MGNCCVNIFLNCFKNKNAYQNIPNDYKEDGSADDLKQKGSKKKKGLQPKASSYSDSNIPDSRDTRKEEILPTEFSKLYELGDIVGKKYHAVFIEFFSTEYVHRNWNYI